MNILGRVAVFPTMPPRISRLYELAYNLWWSWHVEAQALYADLDTELWERVNHNPVRQLAEVSPERLEAMAGDAEFLRRYDAILEEFDRYMAPESPTWYRGIAGQDGTTSPCIAYFSAEFGLHESLPIYSGGLGVLAGDHIKEASDLGLPFVGVGFLYPQGYFTQRITREGVQEANYEKVQFSDVPASAATGPDGKEVQISVDLPGRRVYAKVWRIQIGRNPLFLLDTDVAGNAPEDRELSARLYGGNQELRISQEIVLGIGGLRALRALGVEPTVLHMNDSHPVFAVLERVRELVAEGVDVATAREVTRASTVFTTHTPVPAGNEIFGYDLIDKYFSGYWPSLGLSRDEFHNLARQEQPWGSVFSMTVLALRFSSVRNGVSKLHGAVARRMWQFLWPGVTEDDVPIGHVTNGVHTGTWLSLEIEALYDRYLPKDWEEHVDDPAQWQAIDTVPDAELWAAHIARKRAMIRYARRVVREQRLRLGEGPSAVAEAGQLLDENAFTIGFARRFATYKRATLIMHDLERLVRLLGSPERPVQIIYAGKAHPADEPGKALIRDVYTASRTPALAGKIVFLENYDMSMARHLVSGVDLWLNNPIRPHEASGTSGEKAALNGIPNASILDGWWAEGYMAQGAPRNGWSIGEEREYQDLATQNAADAAALYDVLENDIIPTFFERDAGAPGLPVAWINVMRRAIQTCAPRFSMRRQVKDYTRQLYLPAHEQSAAFREHGYRLGRELAEWKQRIYDAWPDLQVRVTGPRDAQFPIGARLEVVAEVSSSPHGRPGLTSQDLLVELVVGHDRNGRVEELACTALEPVGTAGPGRLRYAGGIEVRHGGSIVYGVRVLPTHRSLANRFELGLVHWA